MLKGKQIRQGDVLLDPIDPADIQGHSENRENLVVAEGEVTGHAHRLTGSKFRHIVSGSRVFLEIFEPTNLVHEEHHKLVVEPGFYEVKRQTETWQDEVRQVRD